MKIIYDRETDILTLQFRPEAVAESDELREDLIVDFDAAGTVVGLELLRASRYVAQPETFAYELKPAG
ncbi:MAG: DUF2283 domain-containing protein [Acidobacteria bacterium]|nr:DUF2283 domain-containing protein [Acidobacteriota bacterium]